MNISKEEFINRIKNKLDHKKNLKYLISGSKVKDVKLPIINDSADFIDETIDEIEKN